MHLTSMESLNCFVYSTYVVIEDGHTNCLLRAKIVVFEIREHSQTTIFGETTKQFFGFSILQELSFRH